MPSHKHGSPPSHMMPTPNSIRSGFVTSESTNHNAESRPPRPNTPSGESVVLNLLKAYGVVLATLSALGAQIGYGVALSLESKSGLDAGVWFASPFDLLLLAGEGTLGMLSAFTRHTTTWDLVVACLRSGAMMAFAVFAAWVVVLLLGDSRRRGEDVPAALIKLAGVNDLHRLPEESIWHRVKRVARSTAVGLVVGTSATAVGMVVIIAAFAVFVALPVFLGFAGGSAYVDMAVLKPTSCLAAPGARHAARTTKEARGQVAANCAELVSSNGAVLAKGRIVLARSSFVGLYLPKEDRVQILSMKDATLRSVSLID